MAGWTGYWGAYGSTGYRVTGYGATGYTGYRSVISVARIRPGLTYPTGDRFRLSVALTEWGLALDDGHVRRIPDSSVPESWMDGAQLHASDELPDGYFVIFWNKVVQLYRMVTPLNEGLSHTMKLSGEKRWTVTLPNRDLLEMDLRS